ncbi:hypothetical protein ACFL4Q_03335 [candidate division KSB1 bacterium]
MTHLKGEALNVDFDGGIKLEFHGAEVIPLSGNGGLLAHRDLDDALGLFDSISTDFHDNRTGRNIQHELLTLLRQSVYPEYSGQDMKMSIPVSACKWKVHVLNCTHNSSKTISISFGELIWGISVYYIICNICNKVIECGRMYE